MRNALIVIGLIILIVWGMSMIDKKRMEEKQLAVQMAAPAVVVQEEDEVLILAPADEANDETLAADIQESADNAADAVSQASDKGKETVREGYEAAKQATVNTAESVKEGVKDAYDSGKEVLSNSLPKTAQ